MTRRAAFFICAIVATLIVVGFAFFWQSLTESERVQTILVDGHPIRAMVVDTPLARAQGLSGRDSLGKNEGMLFVFSAEDRYGIWMKDMRFPIDILWISRDMQVIHVKKNVSPESYPNVFYPPQAAWYVLELQAGFADGHAIQVGSLLRLK